MLTLDMFCIILMYCLFLQFLTELLPVGLLALVRMTLEGLDGIACLLYKGLLHAFDELKNKSRNIVSSLWHR